MRLNDLGAHVTAMNIGIGEEETTVKFTNASDTTNHVATDQDARETIVEVLVKPLDDVAGDLIPTMIKIDVEGYETSVIGGAARILAKQTLIAVLMELNGQGARYGFDESALHRRMLDFGFKPFSYSPLDRQLIDGSSLNSGNTLCIRDTGKARERVQTAPAFAVNGREI